MPSKVYLSGYRASSQVNKLIIPYVLGNNQLQVTGDEQYLQRKAECNLFLFIIGMDVSADNFAEATYFATKMPKSTVIYLRRETGNSKYELRACKILWEALGANVYSSIDKAIDRINQMGRLLDYINNDEELPQVKDSTKEIRDPNKCDLPECTDPFDPLRGYTMQHKGQFYSGHKNCMGALRARLERCGVNYKCALPECTEPLNPLRDSNVLDFRNQMYSGHGECLKILWERLMEEEKKNE